MSSLVFRSRRGFATQARKVHAELTKSKPRAHVISKARLDKVSQLTPSTVELQFTMEDPEFGFRSGNWVDCFIPGCDDIGGFTVTTPPQTLPTLHLAVKGGSNHAPTVAAIKAREGDEWHMRAGGNFEMKDATRNVLFLAGGIGINPMVAMLREKALRWGWVRGEVRKARDVGELGELGAEGKVGEIGEDARETVTGAGAGAGAGTGAGTGAEAGGARTGAAGGNAILLHSARNGEELAFAEELAVMARGSSGAERSFEYVPWLTREGGPGEKKGERFDAAVVSSLLNSLARNGDFSSGVDVCGCSGTDECFVRP